MPLSRSLKVLLRGRSWPVPLMLLVFEVVISLPFLLSHPAPLREEWGFIGRAHTEGWMNAADPATADMRPLVRLLYAVFFGSFGDSPTLLHWIVVASAAALAISLYLAVREAVGARRAFAVAAIWIALPTHLTLSLWPPAININLAGACSLLGLLLLRRAYDGRSNLVYGTVLLVVSVLLYEAVAVLSIGGAAIVVWKFARHRLKDFAVTCLPVTAVVAVVALNSGERTIVWVSPLRSLFNNLGIFREVPLVMVLLFALVMVTAIVCLVRPLLQRRAHSWADVLAFGGLAVVLCGYLPFATSGFDPMFVGLGDRGNAVSALGAAACLVGVIEKLFRNRRAVVVGVCGLATACTFVQLTRSDGWSDYTRATAQVCNELAHRSKPWVLIKDDAVSPVFAPAANEMDWCLSYRYNAERGDIVISRAPPYPDGAISPRLLVDARL